ncbi:MAG: NUDIX domain-containing protein [Clostridia bacterium]|nr:NUDIX domain-containing protein [Clostridia bacterium]
MELWDAYDKNFNKIDGVTLVRGEKIPEGMYHLVADVIVRHTDGEYLLMQRDPGKHYGGMWEATAGGSAIKGETAYECAVRELREETGIASRELVEVGRVEDGKQTLYVEFLCVTDFDKGGVILQEGETSDYKWVGREELLAMNASELVTKRMQSFIDELAGKQITPTSR